MDWVTLDSIRIIRRKQNTVENIKYWKAKRQ
jgi:hypothetical protein